MIPSTLASLEVSGPQSARTIPLDGGTTWRIGRNEQSELVLLDDRVSRNHAIVQRTEDGQFYLIDMGSRNGSFVNDERVSVPRALKDGDSITIGESVMVFRYEGAKSSSSPPQPETLDAGTRALFRPRLITVMVVDIRDFTKLTQQIDPSVLSNLIATWFSHGGRIMRERGSWSQKYIGDALMAVWLHEALGKERDEVLAVIQACAEFAEVTAGLQAQFSLAAPLRVGAGINTGFATIGNAGSGDVIDFTAMGDTVNAAFRMESSTKGIAVDMAIGESTYAHLGGGVALENYFQPHTVALKGYEKPTEVWGAPFAAVERFLAAQRT